MSFLDVSIFLSKIGPPFSVFSQTHLIESHDVNTSTQIDVLGMEAVNSSLLESLLSEGVVSSEGWRQHGVDHEGEDVKTVEETLLEAGARNRGHRSQHAAVCNLRQA